MPITLAQFKKFTSDNQLKAAMKQSVQDAAKTGTPGHEFQFIAARGYKTNVQSAKPIDVFMIVDKAADFDTLFKSDDVKKRAPKLLHAYGVAEVTASDDGGVKVLVKPPKGTLAVHVIVDEVVKNAAPVPKMAVTTPEKEKAAKVQKIVGDSYKKAGLEFNPDQKAVEAKALNIRQVPEYKRFSDNYFDFLKRVNFGNEPAIRELPSKLWDELFQGLISGGYFKTLVPQGTQNDYVLAFEGPQGAVLREKMLQEAMDALKPFTDHASEYLQKVAERANDGTIWAFWSGRCALDAAKASGGISLEGTMGSLFEGFGWSTWPPLIGNQLSELPLWTALSEAYAKKAAEHVSKFKYAGYLGPTASRNQSVFNKIEQPTFIEVQQARQPVHAHIDWYVVDCKFEASPSGRDTFKGAKGSWVATAGPATHFDDRPAAVQNVIKRYES